MELKYILIYYLFNFLKTKVYFIYTINVLLKHCFSNNLTYTNSFYMVIQLTIHYSLIYTYHLILPFFKWFTRQSKLQGSWLNIFSNISHEFRFHKTYVSHRHFYADVPIFTHVSGAVLRWLLMHATFRMDSCLSNFKTWKIIVVLMWL